VCVNAEFASSHELCKTEDQPPAAYLVDDADDCCLLRRRRRRRRLIEEPLRRRTQRQYSHHPPVDMSGRPRTTSFAEGNKTSPNPPLGGIKVISTYLYVLVYTHSHICTFTLITPYVLSYLGTSQFLLTMTIHCLDKLTHTIYTFLSNVLPR